MAKEKKSKSKASSKVKNSNLKITKKKITKPKSSRLNSTKAKTSSSKKPVRKPLKTKKTVATKVKKQNNKKENKSRAKIEIKISKKVTGKAPEEYSFVLYDGRKLRSIQELIDALEDMDDSVFYHHVNDMRNDFSNWIGDIFNDVELADQMRDAKNRFDAKMKLLRKMVDEVTKE